jgi:hypothetical protein
MFGGRGGAVYTRDNTVVPYPGTTIVDFPANCVEVSYPLASDREGFP